MRVFYTMKKNPGTHDGAAGAGTLGSWMNKHVLHDLTGGLQAPALWTGI
jgi:hypothetical protein